MSIGQQGAGKESSGDKRTPIGVYFVTEQLDTSRLHEKYGVTAFPLDYPNAWDKLLERDGDGIWVHGVQPGGGERPKRDTDGCIALPNDNLAELAPEFRDNVTPVVIARKVAWRGPAEVQALEQELTNRVAAWVTSRASGDLHAYLGFYDDSFSRWGMSKREWSALILKSGSFEAQDARVDELLLLAYPGEKDLYFSRFVLTVGDGEQHSSEMTRLFWRRDENGALKIVAEDVG
jgi:murein L,D-transpeptidase YafK